MFFFSWQLGLMSQRKKRGKMRRTCPSVVFRGGLNVLVCTYLSKLEELQKHDNFVVRKLSGLSIVVQE
jgi:hypothetical protein